MLKSIKADDRFYSSLFDVPLPALMTLAVFSPQSPVAKNGPRLRSGTGRFPRDCTSAPLGERWRRPSGAEAGFFSGVTVAERSRGPSLNPSPKGEGSRSIVAH